MKRIQHEEITQANEAKLWKLYQNVSNWKCREHEVEEFF
ncbi:hypothetical protein CLV95_12036 [Leptospira borgpetersenii serovar Javanica]|uniref:Uncharacterized protein n=1 Tax=Leptospira borgpetersenii str. Brem 328 TaxID=1049780 RepID=A0ABC9SK57_LEPBO|nr:Uncharacterized protein LB4E_0509 [Leptospira borgpetersenii str. 4E]EMN18194.1 hypothetical protein LEP1GSC056_1653 [Leptospira borgpetersenii str. Brem 328]PTM43749.1 hypothetical protein CLV95_12036 [Leptospira borgpetersenii serovar Javanica]